MPAAEPIGGMTMTMVSPLLTVRRVFISRFAVPFNKTRCRSRVTESLLLTRGVTANVSDKTACEESVVDRVMVAATLLVVVMTGA